MNRLHDTDVFDDHDTSDREISLGKPTILGIFFVLALMCACFFGAGYTMGRKSYQTATPHRGPRHRHRQRTQAHRRQPGRLIRPNSEGAH